MTGKRTFNGVKPLTHWVIYKGYRVRFTARGENEVRGILTTPDGPVEFTYHPATHAIHLPDAVITVDDYGWEVSREDRPGSSAQTA